MMATSDTNLTIEGLCPAVLMLGANSLAGIFGITGPGELHSYLVTHERDGAQLCWVGVQISPEWWASGDMQAPGVLELVQLRDGGKTPAELIHMPGWAVDDAGVVLPQYAESFNIEAARETFAGLQLLDEMPQTEEGYPALPIGLVLFRGTGLRAAFNLHRIEQS